MVRKPSEEIDDLPKSAGLTFYVPLLPYFFALLFGCVFAGTFQLRVYSNAFLVVGTALILSEFTFRFITTIFLEDSVREKISYKYAMLSLRYVGIFLVCVWYFYFRVDANPYENFAPRETTITAKIDEVSRGANDSRYGVAEIISAPEFLENAKGYKLWFVVSDGKNRTSENKDITVSQVVKFTGIFSSVYPDEVKSRGHFTGKPESRAFEKYLRERFIYFKMNSRIADTEILEKEEARFACFKKVRAYMDKSLSSFWRNVDSNDEASNAYRAMILGDKSLLTKTQKRSYMDTGTMHVFAISGLHIGFATAVLFGILSLLRVNWRIQPVIALPTLYLYVCACGSRPSALRAFAMVALFWCALSLSRGMRPLGALVLSAFVSLLIVPTYIFDAGFVLSYAIVASIFVYSVPLYNYISYKFLHGREFDEASKLQRFLRWLAKYFLGAFCISLGALFVGAPLSAHYFSFITPMSIFYSPLFVSGAGIAVGLGFAGFMSPDFIARCFNEVAVFIVGIMSDFAMWGAKLWSGKIDFSMPSTLLSFFAVFGFLFISAILSRKRSAILRFVVAPIFTISIMLISLLCVGE